MEGVAEEDERREATSMADAAARRRERRAARESGANRRRRRVEEEEDEDELAEEDDEGVEEEDPDAVEGEDSDAKRERQDRRRQAAMEQAEAQANDNAGEEGDEGAPADLNFDRDYAKPASAAGAGAGAVSPDGTVSELQVGVLEDDPTAGGVSRPRNKDSQMGIGPPISKLKVANDDEALDSEALRAFAFKSPQADEDAAANEFEYELPEVAARLGSRLKLLTAGFDEAVWHIPHYTPIASTYSAYSLGLNAWNGTYHTGGYVFDDGTGNPVSDTAGVDPAYGSEYRAEPEPFSEEEIKLARAAGKRRQRKITRELHWQKEKAKAKAREREAKRLKDLADREERSQSGSRGSVFGGSAAASRRASSGGAAFGRQTSNVRSSLQMGGMGASGRNINRTAR